MDEGVVSLVNLSEEGTLVPAPLDITLWDHVASSGYIGLLGWTGVLLVSVLAAITIFLYLTSRSEPVLYRWIWPAAHISSLLFLGTITVGRFFMWPCCGDPLHAAALHLKLICFYSVTGLGIIIGSSSLVSLVLRKMPRPGTWSCLGLSLIALDVLLHVGLFLRVIEDIN